MSGTSAWRAKSVRLLSLKTAVDGHKTHTCTGLKYRDCRKHRFKKIITAYVYCRASSYDEYVYMCAPKTQLL